MILSFAWTTDVLLSGQKTCTRRRWSDRTATRWLNAYQSGRTVHQAWDKSPFLRGAKCIADIKLTQLPYRQKLLDMPESDLVCEGGLWSSREEFFDLFGSSEQVVWVVRFKLVAPTVGEGASTRSSCSDLLGATNSIT